MEKFFISLVVTGFTVAIIVYSVFQTLTNAVANLIIPGFIVWWVIATIKKYGKKTPTTVTTPNSRGTQTRTALVPRRVSYRATQPNNPR